MEPWSLRQFNEGVTMFRKVTTVLLIGGSLALAACNTVRGAGADLGSAANATENAMNR
jgi:predicted small secreted protein